MIIFYQTMFEKTPSFAGGFKLRTEKGAVGKRGRAVKMSRSGLIDFSLGNRHVVCPYPIDADPEEIEKGGGGQDPSMRQGEGHPAS